MTADGTAPVEVEAATTASPFNRWSFWLAAIVASAVVVITLLHIVRDLPNYTGIVTSDPSGTWTGLAVDLANGEFYRPLVSDDGFQFSGEDKVGLILTRMYVTRHARPRRDTQIEEAIRSSRIFAR